MPWVPDSRSPGYLGPRASPQPLEGFTFEDFLHDVFSGITGIDPTLVHTIWQPEPIARPEIDVNWLAFGQIKATNDFTPWIGHYDNGTDQYDILQEHEVTEILCSFYGPQAELYSSFLRRGLYIDQNRAVFRANGVGLVEITETRRAPELLNERWWPRVDMDVVLRREIRFHYNVMTIIRAQGLIEANAPFSSQRVVPNHWDTGYVPYVPPEGPAPPPPTLMVRFGGNQILASGPNETLGAGIEQ